MPALIPTDHYGTITWLGRVADRDAALASAPLTEIRASFAGPEGEAHGGRDLRVDVIDERVVDYLGQLLGNRGIALADRNRVGLQHDLPGILAAREIARDRL